MGRVLEGGRNRASAEEAASFCAEYDRFEQDRENRIEQLDNEFKQKKRALNKTVNEDQKALLAEAKKVGVKKGVIRAIADGQKRIRKFTEGLASAKDKATEGLHKLEADEKEFAVDIVKALGADFSGFGLGAAAVEREDANGKPKEPDAAGIAAVMAEQDAKKRGRRAAKH